MKERSSMSTTTVKEPENPPSNRADCSEVLHWRDVNDELPDEETTVLFFAPEYSEPVWPGWWDGEHWRHDGGGKIPKTITHWAEFPSGPITPNTARTGLAGRR